MSPSLWRYSAGISPTWISSRLWFVIRSGKIPLQLDCFPSPQKLPKGIQVSARSQAMTGLPAKQITTCPVSTSRQPVNPHLQDCDRRSELNNLADGHKI